MSASPVSRYKIIYDAEAEEDLHNKNESPLISALRKYTSFDEIKNSIGVSWKPEAISELREMEPIARTVEIERVLSSIFVPAPEHIELAIQIASKLNKGYILKGRTYKNIRKSTVCKRAIDAERAPSVQEEIIAGDIPTRDRMNTSHILLTGCAGIGKTVTLERIREMYPQVVYHKPAHILQVPFVHVVAPPNGGSVALAKGILDALSKIDPDCARIPALIAKSRIGADDILTQTGSIMNHYNVGILVIDEVQNFLAQNNSSEDIARRLLNLCNTTGATLIMMGGLESWRLIERCGYLPRRVLGSPPPWMPMKLDPEGVKGPWSNFIETLWRHHLLRTDPQLTYGHIKLLHDLSHGVMDWAMKILVAAQIESISNLHYGYAEGNISTEIIQSAYSKSIHRLAVIAGLHTLSSSNVNQDYLIA